MQDRPGPGPPGRPWPSFPPLSRGGGPPTKSLARTSSRRYQAVINDTPFDPIDSRLNETAPADLDRFIAAMLSVPILTGAEAVGVPERTASPSQDEP